MQTNSVLTAAKRAKNDEFYTRMPDIEKELTHYHDFLRGKVVYCNCDDPDRSNFWKYFDLRFDAIGLEGLVATYYDPGRLVYKTEIRRDGMTGKKLPPVRTALTGDGDFRSLECEGLLDGCDVVVTNPPFSLFREFIAQLTAYGKPFIVVGNMNEVICREIFPLVRDGKLWLGHTHPTRFLRPDGTEKPFGNVVWCTNVDMPGRHGPLGLTERYADDPSRYPRYDNYDAIDVGRVADIPMDWDGVMGVPVSFLGRHCPEQFDIVWQAAGNTRACAPPEVLRELGYVPHPEDRGGCGVVDGRRKYVRILVRRRPDA